MFLKNYSKWIVIAGTLLIWFVKFFVRPYLHVPAGLQLLVDVSPNLIGSFLLPFGACWLFKKYFLLENAMHLKLTCAAGLLLVIADEYIQLVPFFGRTFDMLDILSSFAGAAAGYYVYAKMMTKEIAELS